VLFSIFILMILDRAQFFAPFPKEFTSHCKKAFEMGGPEDLEVTRQGLFISSGVHSPIDQGVRRGDLYFLLKDHLIPKNITSEFNMDFKPHGIDALLTQDGGSLIRAINHRSDGDRIETFYFSNQEKTTHLSSIQIESPFHSANDIQSISENEFYVTHENFYHNKSLKFLENTLQLGLGYLTFFDGNKFSKVYEGTNYTNGIAYDREKKRLFVSSMTDRSIHILNVGAPKTPKLVKKIKLDGFPDNLSWDVESKKLIVALHSKILSLKAHSENPNIKNSPSEVILINPYETSENSTILFSSLGEFSSGSSVGLYFNRKIFVGNIYRPGLVICEAI